MWIKIENSIPVNFNVRIWNTCQNLLSLRFSNNSFISIQELA